MSKIELDRHKLARIPEIGYYLAQRIETHGPYEHYPHKPRIVQDELIRKNQGIGKVKAGKIYRWIIEGAYQEGRKSEQN